MLTYPDINPIALSLGPLKIRWYGLMYLVGFAAAWWLALRRAARPDSGWDRDQVADVMFYGFLGVILGGRIGYMLFYDLPGFLAHPTVILKIWQGGMSFHGGLLGVLAGMWWFGRRYHKRLFEVADFVAPLVPIGLGAGRIGNFINGELWGRASNLPWAMKLSCNRFPEYLCRVPRQPSQLYEAFLEGVVLFTILWLFSRRPRPTMAVSGLFLLCYGTFRFAVEFVRQPDPQLGFVAFGWLTMGQVLSFPMALIGLALLWYAYRNRAPGAA
ncbi:MAG: prolipoprotein diacylglyceryl transferase [Chromatiales bacterium 21-64-14]|nr:MAG: prolipoprotein diacylglyceryl transferase [Chromatiales bacterium 21-64-14]HQU16569.1 prolipoprotein diacylglyceryl transferase [Gammaproteobacteria bacterium]